MCIRSALTLFIGALALGACTTVSTEDRVASCQATDWYNYGLNDGILGVPVGERATRFTDCAEVGYPADQVAYQTGRGQGLQQYCTLENGYEVGYDGRRYRKACPPDLEVAFLQGYEQGRKDRPISIRPSIGIGFGFGHYRGGRFGYGYPYFGYPNYRGHYHRGHRGSVGFKGSQR